MEFLGGKILGFALILTRVGAFFAASPVFSWQIIPVRTRIAIAIVLSLFFSALVPCSFTAEDTPLLQIVLLAAQEAAYGLSLGLVTYLIFSVVRQAGGFVEREMGLTMANILDPFTGEEEQPLGLLLEILFVLLLFSTESHHLLLQILSRSYEVTAIGQIPTMGKLAESIVLGSSGMLLLALQMAAPMMGAFLLLLVVLGFMARVAAETNILFLSLPLRVGMGLLIVGIFVPYMNGFIGQFAVWVNRLLPF